MFKVLFATANPIPVKAALRLQGWDVGSTRLPLYEPESDLNQQLEISTLGTNAAATLNDRWTPTNPSNEIPRATSSPLGIVSERYVEDASFLRLKLITLGYTLPKSVSKKLGTKSVKVYISAENLITWTKYTGYDPEVSSYEQNNLYPGIDFGSYPNSKTFISGLNVTF